MSYAAIVAPITVRPHPNADRLQIGSVLGHDVIVGMDTQAGDIGVYFPTDGQLSHEFCLANGLYNASARAELGLPADSASGFFGKNRRVRAQRFRGVKSDGYWVPLSYFQFIPGSINVLRSIAGMQFVEVDGVPICEKYISPATQKAIRAGGHGKPKPVNRMFPKHTDTSQFRYLLGLPGDAMVYITEKLHGTSGRYGRVQAELPNPWYRRLLGLPPKKDWIYLNGSRNVTLGSPQDTNGGFYGSNQFRWDAVQHLQLHKGEVLYFEIVGWVSETTPIMPTQDTTKLQDKTLEKTYGKTMHWTYGVPAGQQDVYVYKALQVNEDGVSFELSWPQVVQRCGELGLKTVPLLGAIYLQDKPGNHQYLQQIVETATEGASTLTPGQIREGVVVRVESAFGTQCYKNKSYAFKVMEGIVKENDQYVDIEEAN